jgi:RimJ/RimL family protein N-acetyltransferase
VPEQLRLELFGAEHLEGVRGLLADRDVRRFTRVPDPPPDSFEVEWLARYRAGRTDGTREAFAAIDGKGRFVGFGVAPHIDREAGEVELGYIVAPAERGRGLAVAILRMLTEWAFSELRAQRIYLMIDVDNPASERVAQRCGYVREGVLRSLHVKQGLRSDTSLWSRLPSDPPLTP